jgi:NifU-like protein
MSYPPFTLPHSWNTFSKKLSQKIQNLRHAGFFSEDEAKERGMRLAVGKEGEWKRARLVHIYLLVDESDGVIADAKFQAFGPSALIGAAETACELLMRKTYDQAGRFTAELLDKQVRDKPEIFVFPKESFGCLNCVVDAVMQATQMCRDISLPQHPIATPLDPSSAKEVSMHQDWHLLNKEQKIAAIEQVIANDIRPYIELDEGGIEIVDLANERELIIAYQGACRSCYASTGSTLQAIEEILRTKLHPQLFVTPDSSFLKGSTS